MTHSDLAESVFTKLSENVEYIHESIETMEIDPKIVEVYQKVSLILSRFKSGQIPKAFKVIPNLRNWQEILELTAPKNWTPNAMLEATKIFASNLPPKVVEIFYREILWEAVRRNFDETKTVNIHYFQALKKAIYKPAAFFKGIIFPVIQDGYTTLKEANVYCSVISSTSIPALHAAAALMKISSGPYSGPKFMIIRSLLDKKFALPTKSISFIFEYFCSFRVSENLLPVLWHQALLVFVQRYKSELDSDRKRKILELIEFQNHSVISLEIIREIEL